MLPLMLGWSAPGRYVLCAALSVAVGAIGAWKVQAWRHAAMQASDQRARADLALEAQRLAGRVRDARQQSIIEAKNAQNIRDRNLQDAADGARDELGRLRHDLAAHSGGLPAGGCAAETDRANTVAELLGQCAGVAADMALKADRHASDAVMLLEAWPKE